MITIHASGPRYVWGMTPEWYEVECTCEEQALKWEAKLSETYTTIERKE